MRQTVPDRTEPHHAAMGPCRHRTRDVLTVKRGTAMFQPMPDDPYSLADLARLAGVTPRTVRYYVAQGLLPSPEQAGPAHPLRRGPPRAPAAHPAPAAGPPAARGDPGAAGAAGGRRGRAAGRGDGRGSGRRADAGPRRSRSSTDLMAQSGVQPRVAMARDVPLAAGERDLRAADPGRVSRQPRAAPRRRRPRPGARRRRRSAAVPPSTPAEPRSPAVDRSTWERLAITPDVELHVRRPLDRRTNKRVEQLDPDRPGAVRRRA